MIATLYALVWSWLCHRPVEGIHLAQYGGMSVLALGALRETFSLPAAYGFSALLTVMLSWLNEILQSVLPNRVYDVRDLALDGIAGVLGLAVAWQAERFQWRFGTSA